MDVLLACFLLSFFSILYFSNSMLVCVCYPVCLFLERHIHEFIRFQLFQPRSYMCIISARVFLERPIHAFFPFLFNFSQPLFRPASYFQNKPYMRSSVPFQTFPTAVLYTFIILARVLNKSYGLTGPGTSLMRCSFTT